MFWPLVSAKSSGSFIRPVNYTKLKVLAKYLADMQLELFWVEVGGLVEDDALDLPKDHDLSTIILVATKDNKNFGVFEDKECELFALKNSLLGFSVSCFQGEDPSLMHYTGCSEQDLEDIKKICRDNVAVATKEKQHKVASEKKVKDFEKMVKEHKGMKDNRSNKRTTLEAAVVVKDNDE